MEGLVIILVVLIILCILFIFTFIDATTKPTKAKGGKKRIKFNTENWLNNVEGNTTVTDAPADVILAADNINRNHNNRAIRLVVNNIDLFRNADTALNAGHNDVAFFILNGAHNVLLDQLAENGELFPEELFLLNIFDNLGIDTAQIRQNNTEQIINSIDKNQPKQAQREEYLEKNQVHVNNPQNVHDSAINKSMAAIMERVVNENKELMKEYNVVLPTKQQLLISITNEDARKVINVCNETNSVMSLGGMSDLEVLQNIYLRCFDKRNDTNTMIESLVDNLKNCIENGQIVCVTGRVSRIISTLILLDYDKQNWDIKLIDDYKSEILDKTKNIIQEVATLALNTTLDKYAREYLIKEREPEDLINIPEIKGETEEDLVNIMKQCIIEMIDEYGTDKYNYTFKPEVLNIIKNENLAVFTI